MPNYTFCCSSCDKKFEIFASIKDYIARPNCLYCRSNKTFRSYIDDISSVHGSIKKHDSELRTIGDLANRNRDKMSDDQKNDLYKKHNDYKESADKPLPKGMNRIQKSKKIKWT